MKGKDVREAERAKWNADQILRFNGLFPEFYQSKIVSLNEETDVIKKMAINLNLLFFIVR